MPGRAYFCVGVWLLAMGTTSIGVAQEEGPGVSDKPAPIRIERTGGPPTIPEVARDQIICFALYTVDDTALKLSAQLYPLRDGEAKQVTLQIKRGDRWQEEATAEVDPTGWLATFRLDNWDTKHTWEYRVVHAGGATYGGTIRRDPVEKETIVLAGLSCNSNTDRGPRADIVANLERLDPDLLFFAGDQSYDHRQHTAAWLLFGRQFGDIIRNRPTITIPDDHDVGHGNLWGEGGGVAHLPGAADGGYLMSPDYVNMVQRAQTSHLPDPFDATPIKQNIGVYYTSLNVGGIDFAIVEDRKWKTGPAGLIPPQGPRPDHINDPDYDRASIDVPEAELLGERQLAFLRKWGQQWRGVEMKAVLSQTIFAGGAHIHGQNNGRLLADLDSNGWPQSGRARALRELRRCFAVHIAGDQHLATVIHQGINDWEDASYSFCVPSIVNYYGRWWWPLEASQSHDPTSPLPFTGRYYDGFGNKVTMLAYANPTAANENGAGFGIVRFHKPTRKITFECWPRQADVAGDGANGQYPGWPITFHQYDNYARKPIAYLPTLIFPDTINPVVQVVNEYNNDIVYTVRALGTAFRPPVFQEGSYTVRVGRDELTIERNGIVAIRSDSPDNPEIEFTMRE